MIDPRAQVIAKVAPKESDLPQQETYFDALDRALGVCPDAVFLDFPDGAVTYRDIDLRSTKMARAFGSLGVARGDMVLTLLDSCADAVVIWFALNKLGAVWVPVNTAYRGEFLRHQVADSLAKLVICDPHYFPNIAAVAEDLPGIGLILCRGAVEETACPIPFEQLETHRGIDETPFADRPDPSDISLLIYTSGTTGRSKGCLISHNFVCNSARQQNVGVPPTPGETTWTCLPLFHVGAAVYVVISTLVAQARARIVPRFSVTDFWNDIERSGATTAMLMASMFPLLAHATDNQAMLRCKGQLRAVTGVPLPAPIRAIWTERFGVAYMNSFGYGQTEVSKICNLPFGAPLPPLDSAGPIAAEFEVIIADARGNPLPVNTPGEILVRPRRPNIMFSGYWRRPEETVMVWRDLWMHTGDIGKLDENGYMYFVDRQKDYVRSRGENISSVEVETSFMAHPDVSEIAFHAISLNIGGEDSLKITVVRREGTSMTEEELCRWSIERLPHFAVPRFVEFRDVLPKTPTGRVQKHKLRDDGCTPTTWDAHAAGLIVRRR